MSNTSGEDTDTGLAHEDSRPGDDMGRWREADPTPTKNGAGDRAHAHRPPSGSRLCLFIASGKVVNPGNGFH